MDDNWIREKSRPFLNYHRLVSEDRTMSATRRALWMMPLIGCVSLTGCATHTGTDAAAGGLLGAGVGALAAGPKHAGAGALVGAGVGALAGGLVGNAQDEAERRNRERIAAMQSQNPPLSTADVIQMSRSGVSDETIITAIRSSNTVYQLTAAEITDLRTQGVSDRVLNYMISSARRPVVVRPAPAVIYEPAPVIVEPPPPGISVGVGYTRYYR
jgi:surface antigen